MAGAPRCSPLALLALCLAVLVTQAAAWTRYGGCYAPNCQTCQSGRPYQCSVCKLGYTKVWSNTCAPCTRTGQTAAACKTYAVTNACACKECNPGYGPTPNLSGQCLPCYVDGCSRFSAGCTCSVCKSGYMSNGSGGCTKCTEAGQTLTECATYQPGTCTCTRCKTGFSLDAATGACVACEADQSVEVCKTYVINTCTCTACKPGYGPVTDGACTPCTDPIPGDECAAFGSVSGQRGIPALGSCACSVCASGYARVYTGDCLQCTADGQNTDACLGFERNSCRCTQCAPKYGPLTRDKRCPPNTCDDAHDSTVCKSYKYGVPCFCTACNPGYVLNNGACLPCTDPARDTECTTYSAYPAWGWYSKGSCTCAVCAPGFAKNYYGDCVACAADPGCAELETNTCRCRKCNPGFGPMTWQRRCPACTNPPASECTQYAASPAPGPGSLGTCSCQTCAANFKRNDNTGDCMPCVAPPNCATPLTNACDGCATCANRYSLDDATKACVECTDNPNCNTFLPNSCDCAPAGCKPGYEGAKCTACTPANCATPLANACDGCATCANRYSLDDATKACVECTDNPNCNTFESNSCDCAASGCKPGYEGAKCTACEPANCATPLANACDGCETCANRYSLDDATKACVECTDNPNCNTFLPNSCDCAPAGCKPGYEGAKCTACEPANCATPLANACDGCETCSNGYSLDDATKACVECTDNPNCDTFESNSCDCAASGCKPGYDGAKCDACVNGWERVGDACQECTGNPSCDTFAAEACDCTKCQSGFALDGTGCTACTDGQAPDLCVYGDNAGVTCVCSECQDSAYMVVDGACVQKATLVVVTTLDPDSTFAAGTPMTLTVAITAEGTVGATSVTFEFALPTDVTWAVDPADPVCTVDGTTGAGTCTLGDLAGGDSATVTITGTPASAGSLAIAGAVAATNVDAASGCTACDVAADITVT